MEGEQNSSVANPSGPIADANLVSAAAADATSSLPQAEAIAGGALEADQARILAAQKREERKEDTGGGVNDEDLVQRVDTFDVGEAQKLNIKPDTVRTSNVSSPPNQGEATPQFDQTVEPLQPMVEGDPSSNFNQEKKFHSEMKLIPEAHEPEETNRPKEMDQMILSQQNMKQAQMANGEDMHYLTSPKVNNRSSANSKSRNKFSGANVELKDVEVVNYDAVQPIQINRELMLRLVKTGVILESEAGGTYSDIEASKEAKWTLNKPQSAQYLNGVTFGRYLIFLKRYMKHQQNQIWCIKIAVINELSKRVDSPEIIRANWDTINAELDKISITIQDENLNAIAKGDQEQVDKVFNRIERYSKMITDPNFLTFPDLTNDLKYADDLEDSADLAQDITEENLSDIISLRHMQTFRSQVSKANVLQSMVTRKETSKFKPQKEGGLGPGKSLTMHNNGLALNMQNNSEQYVKKSQDVASKNPAKPFIMVAEDFNNDQKTDQVLSPKPTEALYTDDMEQATPVRSNRNSSRPTSGNLNNKVVKDGVDILALDAKKPINDCESSLELILVTLSSAFQMSPKQAAALLTNNNQYLITACIKGVKGGRYEPLLSWYEKLTTSCSTLAELLTLELQQLPQSAKQTFIKVMAAIGCGFYSYNCDLVLVTLSLFKSLFTRLKKNSQVHEQALKWFLAETPAQDAAEETTAEQLITDKPNQQPKQQLDMINAGGLRLSLYALGRHRDATKQAMELYEALCDSDTKQLFVLYTMEMQKHTKSVFEYMELVGEFLPLMSDNWSQKALEIGLIDFWLDLLSREAENELKSSSKEKVLAIALLSEIWILFTDYVDDKEAVTNTLLFVFKRMVSERTKQIRLLSAAYLFKVLEKLIERKKKAALTLYRTLISSLVESPYDPTIRELYMANFTELFRINPKMPIEWLVEPLLKQLQTQLGVIFSLKIFDFTFMISLLEHPKFKEEHASQVFSLFAKVAVDEPSYATVSNEVIIRTLSRFLTNSSELLERVKEHIRFVFESLLDLEPISKAEAAARMKRQQRQNALKIRQGVPITRQSNAAIEHGTPGSIGKPPLKAKDLLSQKQNRQNSLVSLHGGSATKVNYQKDAQRRLKKSLMITILLKIQALNIAELNNQFFKDLLYEKIREFKGTYGYFNKGHLELLKHYGDVDQLIAEQDLDPALAEQLPQASSVQHKNTSVKGKLQAPTKHRNSTPKSSSKGDAVTRSEENGGVVAIYNNKDDPEANSRQVVPYGDQEARGARNRSIGGRARALQEIEKIKKRKQDQELKKEAELEKNRKASAKRKKLARQEVEKRKQVLGVADRQPSKLPALMNGDVKLDQAKNSKDKQVQYIKLDEEEDHDRDTVQEFMRKYQKLWRNIFAKYVNTGHKTNNSRLQPSFDDSKKSQVLTFAEVMRLLKDHGVFPTLINKEELSQIVRLVNQREENPDKRPTGDISSLTYSGYQTLMIQVAVHIFSRPPQDLSSQPMVKSLEALVKTFLEATKKRNLSTLLYEDPDAVVAMSQKEKDLLKNLNEKVKEQPDYPMPDGYLKVKEKVPQTEYRVPQSAVAVLGESSSVCVELVDDLVSKLFDFHILEPLITMQEQYRVKPSMQRSLQMSKGERSDRAEALSIIRRAEEKRGSTDGGDNARNRVSLPKLSRVRAQSLQELPTVYSKIVQKQPKKDQAVYTECAYVLENMVRKVCGESEIQIRDEDMLESSSQPSRDNISDGDAVKFNQLKKQQEQTNLLERRQKEKKRQERQRKIKEDLAKLKAEKEVKDAEEAEKRKEEEKRKKEHEKRMGERRQKQREDRIQEIAMKKQEQEAQNAEDIELQAEEGREQELQRQREKREFFKKQQEKLNNQFKTMSDQRKANSLNEQQKAALEKKKKEQLKLKIDQQAKQGNNERLLATEVTKFLKKPEIVQLFNEHEKSLMKYFKFYCRQNKVELGHDLQYRLEHLDFNAFNKLCLQSKVMPVLITSEQMKLAFRNTLKFNFNNQDSKAVPNKSEDSSKIGDQSAKAAASQPVEQSTQMDFDQFKHALIRIAITGQELLGGQSEEQKQRKAQLDEMRRQAEQKKKELLKNRQEQRARLENETLQEMRQEYSHKQKQIQTAMSKSPSKRLEKVQSDGELIQKGAADGSETNIPAISEEEFQRWLKQQDNIGNGLNQRVTEKLANASKPRPQPAGAAEGNEDEGANQSKPNPADQQDAVGESGEQVDSAPLLKSKQSLVQKQNNPDEAAEESNDLDIAFISQDTVKGLFQYMKLEAGDEGERSLDQVLVAQSNYQSRGRANGPGKRGVSKEPTPVAAATTAVASPPVAAQEKA